MDGMSPTTQLETPPNTRARRQLSKGTGGIAPRQRPDGKPPLLLAHRTALIPAATHRRWHQPSPIENNGNLICSHRSKDNIGFPIWAPICINWKCKCGAIFKSDIASQAQVSASYPERLSLINQSTQTGGR